MRGVSLAGGSLHDRESLSPVEIAVEIEIGSDTDMVSDHGKQALPTAREIFVVTDAVETVTGVRDKDADNHAERLSFLS